MKYKYKPNLVIIDYEKLKRKFQFDENGEFETEDEQLIKWIAKNKKKINPIEKVKEEPNEEIKEEKIYKCKKCPFETNNQGELMAHYRKEHPKK